MISPDDKCINAIEIKINQSNKNIKMSKKKTVVFRFSNSSSNRICLVSTIAAWRRHHPLTVCVCRSPVSRTPWMAWSDAIYWFFLSRWIFNDIGDGNYTVYYRISETLLITAYLRAASCQSWDTQCNVTILFTHKTMGKSAMLVGQSKQVTEPPCTYVHVHGREHTPYSVVSAWSNIHIDVHLLILRRHPEL